MNQLPIMKDGTARYTQAEEYLHVASHLPGILLGIGMVFCTVQYHSSFIGLIAGIVFAISLIVLYASSSLYHGMSTAHPHAKRALQVVDHCSIFLLIAGSGTPFVLCSISRVSIPAAALYNLLLWGCAILGIVLLSISLARFKRLSIILYLVMGFSFLAQSAALKTSLGNTGFLLLVAGGALYCVGLVLYSIKVRWMHVAFHILCIIASVLHCICISQFVI